MKILLTGGGSGGHFYPLIAVAEEINRITWEEKLVKGDLYFMSDNPYDEKALFENDIKFKKIFAGKLRRYFSILNIIDAFKTALGIITTFFSVFALFPDVIFSKGGYASFPVIFAAFILRIPLVIHESDTVPGKVNTWAGRFAKRVAVSFPETADYFDKDKTAWTGNPIRKSVQNTDREGAHKLLGFSADLPTIFVVGGSLGASLINDVVLAALPRLVDRYQIIHQTGQNNINLVTETAKLVLRKSTMTSQYKPYAYLDDLALRMAAGAADIIISRAGSGIFEIALWGKPSIIIPITDSNGDHQRMNAAAYERSGSCTVIMESNLTPTILVSEIDRIITNNELRSRMSSSARAFSNPDAAEKIARVVLSLAVEHQ